MTAIDKLDRLKAMIDPKQQTWDLAPKDVEAIRFALQRIDELKEMLDATVKAGAWAHRELESCGVIDDEDNS